MKTKPFVANIFVVLLKLAGGKLKSVVLSVRVFKLVEGRWPGSFYRLWCFTISVLALQLLGACVHGKSPDFGYPVKAPHNLSRVFSIYHEGIDFPKKTGRPVLAAASGMVVYTGEQFSGYGKMILIKHNAYWSSLYAHLHKIQVQAGKRVQKGSQIGEVGSTGRSSAPHLHFEIIHKKQAINPVPFLK